MKILKVIHGYPMRYNAGSEVYSQTVCHGLVKQGHTVQVFTSEENPFKTDGELSVEFDSDEPKITLNVVNNPRNKDRYIYSIIDQRFSEVLKKFQPDIIHIGHLNHLSVSLVFEAKKQQIPVIYTLHDYWIMCPRGQFIQMYGDEVWEVCTKQDNLKCAKKCYARYFGGHKKHYEEDLEYWTKWVANRMNIAKQIVENTELFIAPAKYLKQRYINDFGIPENKIVYLDYGFDRKRLSNRQRKEDIFTFGYIGTHIPAKGIQLLIPAFGLTNKDTKLKIWGRERNVNTAYLKKLVKRLPETKQKQVYWMGEYKNQNIVNDVFNNVDAIVVPSIWMENSPLVIHEAQQARVPVITADVGGMKEYVKHNVNGLLFKHRSVEDLAKKMNILSEDPLLAKKLGKKGYLYSEDGQIPGLDEHIKELEKLYDKVIRGYKNE